jgi:uncharacterized membrane protein YfcA
MKIALFVALGAVTVWFVWAWARFAWKARATTFQGQTHHTWYHALVGFVFAFFDTLGIGNFAPTTSAFKLRGSVPDEKIPGTLNIGYALPTIAQAFIYISIVEVDAWTLVLMIVASILGAWLGAGFVARWPRRTIQIGMGFALIVAATLMLLKQLNIGPPGGDTLALTGLNLGLGLVGNFILGALMTLGIGLYGPCLILVSLLGMNPKAAFPIMMGSCAFLMPIGGIRFVRAGSYSLGAALILTVAGIPAVLIAAYIVKEMPLDAVRWLVVVVVLITAGMMLRSAFLAPKAPAKAVTPESPTPVAGDGGSAAAP